MHPLQFSLSNLYPTWKSEHARGELDFGARPCKSGERLLEL
jgi:hypothetical protein